MERWLKSPEAAAPAAPPTSAAIKARIEARWDSVATREAMLDEIQKYYGEGRDPTHKGQVDRAEADALLHEVYKAKFPEDFPKAVAVEPKEEPLEEPVEGP